MARSERFAKPLEETLVHLSATQFENGTNHSKCWLHFYAAEPAFEQIVVFLLFFVSFCFICIGFINLECVKVVEVAVYTNETMVQLKTESFHRMRHSNAMQWEHIYLRTIVVWLNKNHFQFWLIVSLTQCKIFNSHSHSFCCCCYLSTMLQITLVT